MKRITSLFILLMVSLLGVTVMAQSLDIQGKFIKSVGSPVLTPGNINESKYYILYNTGRNWFPYENEDTTGLKAISQNLNDFVNTKDDKLKVIIRFEQNRTTDDTRHYYLKTVSGKYLKAPTHNSAVTLVDSKEEAGFFLISRTYTSTAHTAFNDGYFFLRGKTSEDDKTHANLNGNPTNHATPVVGWATDTIVGTGSNNSIYRIYPVTIEETSTVATVTLKYKLNGKIYQEIPDVLVEKGKPVPSSAITQLPYIRIDSYDYQNENVPDDLSEINITCSPVLPFQVSENTDNLKWQSVEIHRNQGPIKWKYAGDDEAISTVSLANLSNKVYEDAYLWAFTGNLIDGFKIHNKAAGDDKWVRLSGDYIQISATDDNNLWFLKQTRSYDDKTDNCCFHLKNDNRLINRYAPENKLKTWTDNDQGSTCHFMSVAEPVLNRAKKQIGRGEVLPLGAVGTFNATADQLKPITDAYDAALADPYDFDKANLLGKLYSEAPYELIKFVPNAYYRIVNASRKINGKNCMLGFGVYNEETMPLGNEPMSIVPHTVGNVNLIWYLEQDVNNEDRVHFKNANMGKYMSMLPQSNEDPGAKFVETISSAGSFLLTPKEAENSYTFKITGTLGGVMHQTAGGNSWRIFNYDFDDPASYWYLIPAHYVEVPLLSNGNDDASYATAYFPFDVASCEGATMYTGKVNGENVDLYEATEGVAANNAIILKGEKGAQKATIFLGEGTGTSEGLSGTNVIKNVAANSVLTLGRSTDNSKGTAFYTFTGTSINANKTYIENAVSQALKLNFGETTGIGSIVTDNDSEGEIYDLSGRRIESVSKGGLYIRNGKKIIVK